MTDGGEAAGTSQAPFTIAVNDGHLERETAAAEAFKAITHCGETTGISPIKGTIWGGASDTSQAFLAMGVKAVVWDWERLGFMWGEGRSGQIHSRASCI
jgi:hypothetical protein